MAHSVLNALKQVTLKRDVDSLEMTLVLTLFEYFKSHYVALYEIIAHQLERKITLTVDENGEYRINSVPEFEKNSAKRKKILEAKAPFHTSSSEKETALIAPIVDGGETIGAFEIRLNTDIYDSQDLPNITIFTEIYQNYLSILRASERDKLTNLYNRNTFEIKLSRLLINQRLSAKDAARDISAKNKRHYQHQDPAWLAIIDVDHFKQVNDVYGHVCGDEILLNLSNVMRNSFRREDLLFRYGGEEFIIILAPTQADQAHRIFDEFREHVKSHNFPLVDGITISIGFTEVKENEYPMRVIEKADKALYHAKEHGRNQVSNYQYLESNGFIEPSYSVEGEVDLF